jgi:hypothetical protein
MTTLNARTIYAQHAREHQGSIDAKTGEVAKKLADDWAELKNRLTAHINLIDKPYDPVAWRLNSIEIADEEILMALSPKVEVENIDD